MIHRISTATVVALSVAASGLLLVNTAGASAAAGAAADNVRPTNFALQASGYATRVSGGQVPSGSDRSAFQVIGCTNLAGLDKNNYEAEVDLGLLGTASAAKTRVRTTEGDGVVSAWSRDSIAKVVLVDSATSRLTLKGVSSTSRAFHDRSGFHATTNRSVTEIFTTVAGVKLNRRIPTAGNPVLIPGIAKISLGPSMKRAGAGGAAASADALRIELLPSGTVVRLAHSRAQIDSGAVSGIFRGSSYASKAQAASGRVTSKMTPYLVMPCQGTDGDVKRRSIAKLNPAGLSLTGLFTAQLGEQRDNSAEAWERGKVSGLNLGQGDLVVRAIVGQANVHFVKGEGVSTDIKGSTLGRVTTEGSDVTIPRSGVLRIPRVAKLERNVVTRTPRSITVIALRVTLLDGTGAVVNLGRASVGFTPSAF